MAAQGPDVGTNNGAEGDSAIAGRPMARQDISQEHASAPGQNSLNSEPTPWVAQADMLAHHLGHPFARPQLLRDALTHRSYLNETSEQGVVSNERLEFLGDAVAGLISADILFNRFSTSDEGMLTQTRAALVRSTTLAAFAREIDLGTYLRLGRSEEISGGRNRTSVLAGAFEALVGALYEDGGIEEARRFIEPLLSAQLDQLGAQPRVKDDKSLLQELAQGRLGITPRYQIVSQTGPAHERTFVVAVAIGDQLAAQGEGRNKQQAEQSAAHNALRDQGWLEQT